MASQLTKIILANTVNVLWQTSIKYPPFKKLFYFETLDYFDLQYCKINTFCVNILNQQQERNVYRFKVCNR